jgi:hypothetical protein
MSHFSESAAEQAALALLWKWPLDQQPKWSTLL